MLCLILLLELSLRHRWSLLILRHWRPLFELLPWKIVLPRSTSCRGPRRNVRGRFRSMIPRNRTGLSPLLLSIVASVAVWPGRILRHRPGPFRTGKPLLRRRWTACMHSLRWRSLPATIGLVMARVVSLHVLLAASSHRRSPVLLRPGRTTSSALLWHSLRHLFRAQVHQGHGLVYRSGFALLRRRKRRERVVLGTLCRRGGGHAGAFSSYF
jgi:hypothetical protein